MPKIYHASAGLLSLVSAGKNLVGSQFFFTLAPNLTSLDGAHCVIGEVVEGHDTLRKLNEAIVDENFRPYQDIRITHTVVLEDPFPDPRNLKLPSRSPSPTPQRLQNGRIAADEDIDDTDGKTAQELQEMLADREAKARATILEIVGDLPDAEMAPPENVLFVCKLNPVTTDDDLEIIFSRFGKVKNCEVIRDRKTGDSLQYAFVEFEDQKACEAAYFKMDNVLIDDRRIHVDFSQSVAKVKWRGKGRGVEGSLTNSEFDNLQEADRKQKREGDNERYKRKPEQRMKHISSTERRLAREERHREQREKKYERKEQDICNRDQGSSSYDSKRVRNERYTDERKFTRSPDRHRQSRSHSLERSKKYSSEWRRSPDRHRKSRSRSVDLSKKLSQDRERRNRPDQSRERKQHKSNNSYKEKKTERSSSMKRENSKSKRTKKASAYSSDDSDSSGSDADSDSSSTESSSSSVSSSNEKRRQKRKHKVVKKKKSERKSHKSERNRRK
ncbi:peptidyl-prolyl cis-trans isomerase sig-7-like isoform X2 [Eurosta solidaginis]